MALKVLVFDLDDTLVVEKESAAAAFRVTCQLAAERLSLDPAALHASIRESCRELWHHHNPARAYAVAVGISSWEALWSCFAGEHPALASLTGLGSQLPLHRMAPRAANPGHRRFQLSSRTGRDLSGSSTPDATSSTTMSAPFSTSGDRIIAWPLLTNGASDLQREKLNGANLAPFFEEVLVAGDIGLAKPHPELFQTLLARLNVAPAETVMFGDSQSKDIQGAQAIGMKAVWVNRAAVPRRDGITPDLEVATLADGAEWIAAHAVER